MKFLYSFAASFMGMALGFTFKRLVKLGTLRIGEERAEALRSALQKFTLLVLFALMPGLLSGFAGSRLLALPPGQAGVYVQARPVFREFALAGLQRGPGHHRADIIVPDRQVHLSPQGA